MSTPSQVLERPEVVYPESDGLPMGENTIQFRWIVTLHGGLDALFYDEPNVFVAGDLFWYPVEGNEKIRTAPDVMVVFGRPRGDRSAYLQWREGGIAPQVVFEIQSPGNSFPELMRKFRFYERYGVEEYYLYAPQTGDFNGWIRSGQELQEIAEPIGWTSPRLNVRFEMQNAELQVIRPDGRPFETFVEVVRQREAERAEKERERERAERLAAQLRSLGVEPQE